MEEDLFPIEAEELDSVFPSDITTAVNPYTQRYTQDRAFYSTLAVEPMSGDEAFFSIFQRNEELIANGREEIIERQAAQGRALRQTQANLGIQKDLLYTPNSSELIQAFEENRASMVASEQKSAIEKEAMQRYQDLMVEDPYQAAIYVNRLEQGDLLDRQRDHAVKLAIFQREADKLRSTFESQGFVGHAVDFLVSTVDVPLTEVSRALNITKSATGEKQSLLALPSQKRAKEAASIWDPNLSVDEFDVLVTAAAERARINSGVFKDNAGLAAMEFANLKGMNNSDALTYDLFAGVNVLSVPGVGLAAKAATNPVKFAKYLGNRSAAVRSTAAEILDPSNDVQQNALAVTHSLPNSVVPDMPGMVDPTVGLSGDVGRKVRDLQQLKNELQNIVTPDRAAPGQYAEAVVKKSEELAARFADENIVDMKAVTDADNIHYRGVADKNQLVQSSKGITYFTKNAEYASEFGDVVKVRLNLKNAATEQDYSEVYNTLIDNNRTDYSLAQLNGIRHKTFETLKDKGFDGYIASDETVVFDQAAVTKVEEATTVGIDKQTGIRYINLYLGKTTGEGGYISEKSMRRAAEARGFAPEDISAYHGPDDRWYIKYRADVAENGIVAPELKKADFPETGRIWGYIKNPDNSVAQIFSEARHLSEGARSRVQAQVIRPLIKELKRLSNDEIITMNKVLISGEKKQRWFTPEELHLEYERVRGTPPTDKEIVSYYATKELNDVDWSIRNREAYVKRVRQGYETIRITDGAELDTGRRNGIVLSSNELAGKRVFDVEEHTSFSPGSNDAKLSEKLATGNYSLVRLEGTFTYADEQVKYILVNNRSMTRGALERNQLGYRPGGHRLYKDKWFVKQANSIEFKDGTTGWNSPLTHIVAKTKAQADRWAAGMEEARKAYNELVAGRMTPAEVEMIISENTTLDLAKFDELVKSGAINRKHAFETLYDRTQPSEMTGVGTQNLWIDEIGDGTDQWYATNGRMYYSPKGDHLKNPFDEYAEILDPFETLQRSINNALTTRALSDYTTFVVEEWARVASPYIKKGSFGENPDKRRLFMDGIFDENAKANQPEFISALETNRDVIKRFMTTQTAEMHGKQMAMRRLAGWLESNKGPQKLIPSKAREYLAGKAMDMLDANPVAAVRGLVFDTQLGFFDPGQFVVQTQTALAAVAIDPVNGARATAMWPAIRLVGTNLKPQVLDYVAKNLKDIHGLDPDEFKDMIRVMMKTGEYDIGGDLIELGNWTNRVGGSAVAKGFSDFRQAGRVVFNEAEKMNRTVAWQLAWKEVRSKQPKLDVDSPQFMQAVKMRANDFGMNMRHASSAGWQKGIMSIPTQFMSYQMRLLENMLPEMFGGNPRFTGAQKFRLALSQAFLYGAAGIPIADWAADEWKKNRPDDLTPEAWRAVTKGFWDTFFYTVSGGEADLDFASRAGIGQGWSQTVEKIIDGDLNSMLSVMAGPTGTVTGDFFDSFQRVALYGRAGLDGGLITGEAFNLVLGDLAANINTLERANKAAMILRYGKTFDRKTGQQIVSATQMEALAAALGIPLAAEGEIYDMLDETYDRKDDTKQVAQVLAKINDNFFRAMENGDEKGMDSANKLRAAILQSYYDDPLRQQQIAKAAITMQSYTTDRMGYAREQYQQILGKQPMTERQ